MTGHPETIVAGEQADRILSELGLSPWGKNAHVARKTFVVGLEYSDGHVTVEVERTETVTVEVGDVLIDFPEMVRAIRSRGHQL